MNWGPTIKGPGFDEIPSGAGYTPKQADIVVMQSTSQSKDGHIAEYDGKNWVSDFVQREFWPGDSFRREKPAFTIYRRNP
jgi:hypothetical protein